MVKQFGLEIINNMVNKIELAILIGTDIYSENNIDKIIDNISDKSKHIILDFSNVIFMSRSFTEKLIYLITQLKKDKYNVEMINQTYIVKSMINGVKNSLNKPHILNKIDESNIKRFKDFNSFMEYLDTF